MRHALTYVTDPTTGKVYPVPAGGAEDGDEGEGEGEGSGAEEGSGEGEGKPEPLGEGGKRALDAERKARREAERKAKRADELEAELEQFRKDAMSEQERAIEEAKQQAAEAARNEVLEETRQDRLKTKVEAAATGRFADPADAHAFVDLSDLDPDDTAAIAEEIDRVLEAKPYLKAGATQANDGDIDQGTRKTDGVKQLSRADLRTMSSDEIAAARSKGQLRDLMTTGQ